MKIEKTLQTPAAFYIARLLRPYKLILRRLTINRLRRQNSVVMLIASNFQMASGPKLRLLRM
ncbi:hypothetical protein Lpp124_10838 [Lacticaseibacillus paracasei subsp. paracasei CNCM I-4649]|nr:hypothetical protein Lpp124_10838 [Lacticaseibacillus paracasei subsp. paracasei CNCM I-4649]